MYVSFERFPIQMHNVRIIRKIPYSNAQCTYHSKDPHSNAQCTYHSKDSSFKCIVYVSLKTYLFISIVKLFIFNVAVPVDGWCNDRVLAGG